MALSANTQTKPRAVSIGVAPRAMAALENRRLDAMERPR